jgi:hypothetical protein
MLLPYLRHIPFAWFSSVVLGLLSFSSSKKTAPEQDPDLPAGHTRCNSYYCDYC